MTRIDINFNDDGSGQPGGPVDVDALAKDINLPQSRQEKSDASRILREWAKEMERQRKEEAKARESERRERRKERERIHREAERNVRSAARDRARESRESSSDSPQGRRSADEYNDEGNDSVIPHLARTAGGAIREGLWRHRWGRNLLRGYDASRTLFNGARGVASAFQSSRGSSLAQSVAAPKTDGFELLHEDSKPVDVDALAKHLRSTDAFGKNRMGRPIFSAGGGKHVFHARSHDPSTASYFASSGAVRTLPSVASMTAARAAAAGGAAGGTAAGGTAAAGAAGGVGALGVAAGAVAIPLAAVAGAAIGAAASLTIMERIAYSSSETLRRQLGGNMPAVSIARSLANVEKTMLALRVNDRIGGRLASIESSEASRERLSLRRDEAMFKIFGPYTEARELLSLVALTKITNILETYATMSEAQGGHMAAMLEMMTLGIADGKKTVDNIAFLLGYMTKSDKKHADEIIAKLRMAGEAARRTTPGFGPAGGGAL